MLHVKDMLSVSFAVNYETSKTDAKRPVERSVVTTLKLISGISLLVGYCCANFIY